jgi:hypothetical protein
MLETVQTYFNNIERVKFIVFSPVWSHGQSNKTANELRKE